jgi:hypothetical protein
MHRLIINSVLFSLVGVINTFAQGNGFAFGEVSLKELEMRDYPHDSSAVAVVLNEFGEVFFEDGKMILEYQKKVKILKQEGVDEANFSVFLRKNDSNKEVIHSIEGVTHYLENGSLKNSKLERNAIFYEENPTYTLVKFTLPHATTGSLIEIKYSVSSPFIFNLYPWEFQSDIPKLRSEFWTKIPANYSYNASLKGLLKLTMNESKLVRNCFTFGTASADCGLSKFAMTNIPAFKVEKFMTAKGNFLSAINFELEEIKYFDGRVDKITKEWKDVEEELLEHEDFGGQIRKTRNLFEGEIAKLLEGVIDPLDKAKAIYNWIKRQYTWNEKLGKYAENGVKKAFEIKTGNIADINISLLGALRSADLSTNAVILSTRLNGLPNSLYPVLSDFNYIVVRLTIGENSFLLDASEKLMPFGLLPEMCLNGKGRLLAKKNSSDISLEPCGKEKTVTTLTLKLNEQGILSGKLKKYAYDYNALDERKLILSYSTRDDYIKALEKKWSASEIKNYSIENLEELEKPLIETMEIVFEGSNAATINRIYFNPFIAGKWKDNPFNSKDRIFPVDFGVAQEETVVLILEYPAEFHLDEIPQNIALALPNKGGKFLFNCSHVGNNLNISYSLNLARAVYSAEEYHSLRELFTRIVQLKQTDLVFIKD